MERKIDRLVGHAVICGFGRVGRRIARQFAEVEQLFVVIDKLEANAAGFEAAEFTYLHGDATEDATLLAARVRQARALLASTDDDTENIKRSRSARALAPSLWIVAGRANRDETEGKLVRAGADRVLSPYALGGHRMAGLARQPHLMEFLDTTMKSRGLDLALSVIQVEEYVPPYYGLAGDANHDRPPANQAPCHGSEEPAGRHRGKESDSKDDSPQERTVAYENYCLSTHIAICSSSSRSCVCISSDTPALSEKWL